MMVAATPNKTPGRAVASKCQRSAETIIRFRCGREQGDLVDGLDAGAEWWWLKIVTVRTSTLAELLT
jgi:hypothetical protein